MMRTSILGGRLVDPANGIDAVLDLHLAKGRVVAVGAAPEGFTPDRIIDAREHVVCPGIVDLRARLREPGLETKTTIATEVRAAVCGGITTLCSPPDTDPVVDTRAVVELIHQRAARAGLARVEVIGALTWGLDGEQLAEMGALAKAGCPGVSNASRPIRSSEVMRRALEYAATFGLPVLLHPEDPWLAAGRHAHEGAVATRLGLPGIPETAETIIVARDLLLIEQTGARAHFCSLSSGRSLAMVAEAQSRGLPVTADVNAHHLHLTEMDLLDFDATCHLCPPLRTERDRDALRAGLARGTLTAVVSDHQPHESDAKLQPFPMTETGMSGLETLLALTLKLAFEGILDLSSALAALTVGPARVLNLERGDLAPGRPADVCIFHPQQHWTLDPQRMVSRGRNSAFLDWEFQGRVRWTLVGGKVVYEAEA